MREKHLGIWRAITWREYGERARHVGLGLVALGLPPARRRLGHRRQLPGVALHRSRHHVGGRRHQRHLHDRLAPAGRVHRERQRHPLLLRRERGAARQDPGSPRPLPAAGEDLRVRHGGPARLPRRAGDAVRGAAGARRALRARAPRCLRPHGRDRPARRPGDPGLHLGHHRPAQGRHAQPPATSSSSSATPTSSPTRARGISSCRSCRCPTSPSGPSRSSIRCAPAPP